MRKFAFKFLIYLIILIFGFLSFLSLKGFETEKFNNLILEKINSQNSKLQVDSLNKIKIKLDYKKLSLFLSTKKPKLNYREVKIPVKELKIYLDFVSLMQSKIEAKNIKIDINKLNIKDIQKLSKGIKPSNTKSFILNNISKGIVGAKMNVDFNKSFKITNYYIEGSAEDTDIFFNKIHAKDLNFNFIIENDVILIESLSAKFRNIPITNGIINIDRKNNLIIDGSFDTNVKINNNFLKDFSNQVFFNNNIKIAGSFKNSFKMVFSKTLALDNYSYDLNGKINNATINLKDKISSSLLKNDISFLELKKTDISIKINKQNNTILLEGLYKLNDKTFQKYKINSNFDKKKSNYDVDLDFSEHVFIDLINYEKPEGLVANLSANLNFIDNSISIKKFLFSEKKNTILLNNIKIKNKKLLNFKNIEIKTFKDKRENNNFKIEQKKKIYIVGSKYDSTNLLKTINSKKKNNFLDNISKDVDIRINKISTKLSESLNDFTLIGKIEKGNFAKILSKSEFSPGNYFEINLKKEESTGNKKLEIFSDLPRPILADYKFFSGIEGGKLIFNALFNETQTKSNLVIENFKVRNAPGFAKLLALADFGGVADLLSGEGISFDRLEINLLDEKKVLNIKEIFAVGPSISILMEGYLDNTSGLISLKGTMVPAKELNKLISKIPLIGSILIPKDIGEGLFGVSFKIKGLPGKTKTSVNPIKTLTPRFITKALEKRKESK